MKKKELGKTGIHVTPVGMGVLTIGNTQLALSLEAGARVVRYAVEQGINFLDTAEYYHTYQYIKRAMNNLASAFDQGALSRPVIASKSLVSDYDGMRRAIDDCRTALNLDIIDIFLLHEVRQPPDFADRSGAWACLQDAKAKGHVKAIGISTHHTDAAAEAVQTPGVDILFPLINFQGLGIRKGGEAGSREDMEKAIKDASAKGIGVFAMKAFGGGNLTPYYVEALDYVTRLPGIDSTMIGLGSVRDVADAVAYFEGRLPADFVPNTKRKHMFIDRGDCEGCGACAAYCTSKAISMDDEGIAVVDTEACIMCGYCVQVCPTRALIML